MCSATLPCPLCCQPNFPNVDSLRISLVSVTNRQLHCPICNEILMGLDKLTIHLFSHTISHQEAPLADENYTPQNEKATRHRPNNIKTELCETISPSHSPSPAPTPPDNNTTPQDSFSLLVDEPQCAICGVSFRNKKMHEMHMRLVHEIDINALPSYAYCSQNSDEETPSSQKSRYQCHLCSKYFKMKGSLRVHLRVVHLFGMPLTSGNALSNGRANATHISRPTDNSASNSYLNASDLTLNTLMNVKHSAAANLQQFENKMSETVKTTSPDEPPIMASQTLLSSPSTSVVVVAAAAAANTISVNVESKLWECDICAKSFTTKYFLKKHKRLHTGEMPYTCELCAKTFTFQQSYHKHLLYHNDDKPHMCNTCGRAFKELSTLHNHERIHSGEKPFKCETCDKCFRQRVSYLVHRRIHTGVMPYKCTACEKSFRYKVSQRTHKCLAQPPGTVIRQTGDLLQRLIQSSALNLPLEQSTNIPTHHLDEELDASSLTHNMDDDSTKLVTAEPYQSLDDFVVEHCNKIGIGHQDEQQSYPMRTEDIETQIPSPSEKFQNLCLYSPPMDDIYSQTLETIDETTFKQFLYGTDM